MALRGRQTKKTLLPSKPEDGAGPSDFISRRPARGALKPAPPLIVRLILNGRGRRGRVQSDPGSSCSGSSLALLAIAFSLPEHGERQATAPRGRQPRVDHLGARGNGARRRHPFPSSRGWTRVRAEGRAAPDARARLRAPGRAGLDVARAPPAFFPHPAVAPARPRAAGRSRARAPVPSRGRRALGDARVSTGTRGIQTGPGTTEEKRASGLGARPTQVVPVSVSLLPLGAGSREQVAGMPARGGGGAAGGDAGVSLRRRHDLGACTARHRADLEGVLGGPPGLASPSKASRVRGVHPAETGTALPAGACAHGQAWPLGQKPWTNGAFGSPGWGLRVEPRLGK